MSYVYLVVRIKGRKVLGKVTTNVADIERLANEVKKAFPDHWPNVFTEYLGESKPAEKA